MLSDNAYETTLKYLKGHPDAIVCIAMALIIIPSLALGEHPFWVVGGAAIVLIFYHYRRRSAEGHAERMAAIDVDNVQSRKGTPIKERGRAKLDKPSSTEVKKAS